MGTGIGEIDGVGSSVGCIVYWMQRLSDASMVRRRSSAQEMVLVLIAVV